MIDAASSLRAKRAFIVHRTCDVHKSAIITQIIYEITYLKRLFTGWKDYLQVGKDYLRLWPSFFRIVSLFLITWRTFQQPMDKIKNIWMLYIANRCRCADFNFQSRVYTLWLALQYHFFFYSYLPVPNTISSYSIGSSFPAIFASHWSYYWDNILPYFVVNYVYLEA